MFQEFSATPGIKVEVPNEPKAKFFFSLLCGDKSLDLSVRETNRYARDKLTNKPAQLEQWKDITREELRAYFGLALLWT